MTWTGITGFLASTFLFPFKTSHSITTVAPPVEDCRVLCAKRSDCCLWGVRAVKHWSETKDETEGVTHLGWEVTGQTPGFQSASWCLNKVCADALEANRFSIKLDPAGGKLYFWAGTTVAGQELIGDAQKLIGLVTQFPKPSPGKAGVDFYVLVVMTQDAFTFFDTTGKKRWEFKRVGALKDLKGDPQQHGGVDFVKSYSCGQFRKDASAAKIRLHSHKWGFLVRCGGAAPTAYSGGAAPTVPTVPTVHTVRTVPTVPTESNVDQQAAFAAALARVNHQWSVDASAGSHGISFASIVCAVLSSVSLVFLVFFVAKKNSHLEVAVADE